MINYLGSPSQGIPAVLEDLRVQDDFIWHGGHVKEVRGEVLEGTKRDLMKT
jgi:hypothetical protein